MDYEEKYLKYKVKYFNLMQQVGGTNYTDNFQKILIDYFKNLSPESQKFIEKKSIHIIEGTNHDYSYYIDPNNKTDILDEIKLTKKYIDLPSKSQKDKKKWDIGVDILIEQYRMLIDKKCKFEKGDYILWKDGEYRYKNWKDTDPVIPKYYGIIDSNPEKCDNKGRDEYSIILYIYNENSQTYIINKTIKAIDSSIILLTGKYNLDDIQRKTPGPEYAQIEIQNRKACEAEERATAKSKAKPVVKAPAPALAAEALAALAAARVEAASDLPPEPPDTTVESVAPAAVAPKPPLPTPAPASAEDIDIQRQIMEQMEIITTAECKTDNAEKIAEGASKEALGLMSIVVEIAKNDISEANKKVEAAFAEVEKAKSAAENAEVAKEYAIRADEEIEKIIKSRSEDENKTDKELKKGKLKNVKKSAGKARKFADETLYNAERARDIVKIRTEKSLTQSTPAAAPTPDFPSPPATTPVAAASALAPAPTPTATRKASQLAAEAKTLLFATRADATITPAPVVGPSGTGPAPEETLELLERTTQGELIGLNIIEGKDFSSRENVRISKMITKENAETALSGYEDLYKKLQGLISDPLYKTTPEPKRKLCSRFIEYYENLQKYSLIADRLIKYIDDEIELILPEGIDEYTSIAQILYDKCEELNNKSLGEHKNNLSKLKNNQKLFNKLSQYLLKLGLNGKDKEQLNIYYKSINKRHDIQESIEQVSGFIEQLKRIQTGVAFETLTSGLLQAEAEAAMQAANLVEAAAEKKATQSEMKDLIAKAELLLGNAKRTQNKISQAATSVKELNQEKTEIESEIQKNDLYMQSKGMTDEELTNVKTIARKLISNITKDVERILSLDRYATDHVASGLRRATHTVKHSEPSQVPASSVVTSATGLFPAPGRASGPGPAATMEDAGARKRAERERAERERAMRAEIEAREATAIGETEPPSALTIALEALTRAQAVETEARSVEAEALLEAEDAEKEGKGEGKAKAARAAATTATAERIAAERKTAEARTAVDEESDASGRRLGLSVEVLRRALYEAEIAGSDPDFEEIHAKLRDLNYSIYNKNDLPGILEAIGTFVGNEDNYRVITKFNLTSSRDNMLCFLYEIEDTRNEFWSIIDNAICLDKDERKYKPIREKLGKWEVFYIRPNPAMYSYDGDTPNTIRVPVIDSSKTYFNKEEPINNKFETMKYGLIQNSASVIAATSLLLGSLGNLANL